MGQRDSTAAGKDCKMETRDTSQSWTITEWTPQLVATCLLEAARTFQRTDPEALSTFPILPTAAGRAKPALQALRWLQWLDALEGQIAWARANGRPWKAIAHRHGIDRTTAWRRWTCAMVMIAARLNGEQRNNVATSSGDTIIHR
jgi:hypothetical protein